MMLNIYRSIFAFNLIAATALFLICLYLSDPRYQLVALGHFAFTTLLFFPVAMRTKVRPIEPFNLVVLYVAIGTLGNSYIIAFSESTRREVLTNGEPIELFIWGALWLCSGLFVLGFGYSMTTRRVPVERILPNEARISSMGIHVSTLLALGLSVIATLVFVESTGGLSATVSEISRKRAIEVVSDGEIVYASAGYLRLVAGLPMLYLYILLSYYLRRSETLTHGNKALLLALLIAGLAIPFIASSRASIAYSMIGLLVVYSVYRPISMKMLVVAGVISLAFFSAMTGLRATSQQKLTDSKVLVNPIVAIAQSGNGVSLNGTALIMDGVPERMDFKLGYTFLTWLASPIPRSVWPNKPDISLGKEIKGTILQKTVI